MSVPLGSGHPAGSEWTDALAAAHLLAADLPGLGGAVLRARAGPVRDAWLAAFAAMLPPGTPVVRVPGHVDIERLTGGIDLAATLAAGRPVASTGLLARAARGVLIAPMAERMGATVAAALAYALDAGGAALIAFDEGVEDEAVPAALAERLAFRVALDGVGTVDLLTPAVIPASSRDLPSPLARLSEAGWVLAQGRDDDLRSIDPIDPIATLCAIADAFGIASPRAALFALNAARTLAQVAGRDGIGEGEINLSARLVLGPRATRLPPAQDVDAAAPEPEDDAAGSGEDEGGAPEGALADRVVEAVRAALPDHVLASLAAGSVRAPGQGKGAGAKTASPKSGRPVGTRRGDPRTGARLSLVATLTAAAPWQPLRRAAGDGASRFRVTPDDFRVRRFEERRQSTTILVVDASGSAAFERLAEAKGAVELILADAYIKRAQAALIAFRGTSAETLLPPTRSLARAKRGLAELAGGGGTPLAAGVEAAWRMAEAERARGRTPFVVFLTDARANVGLGGAGGRAAATEDAAAMAKRLRTSGIAAVVIDTAQRPGPAGAAFAAAMGARYSPLPMARAAAVAATVGAMVAA